MNHSRAPTRFCTRVGPLCSRNTSICPLHCVGCWTITRGGGILHLLHHKWGCKLFNTNFQSGPLSCTKYVWYHGHRDHISCIPKTEELFEECFYWLKAPGGRLWMSSHTQVTTNLRRTQMPTTWLSSNITVRCTTSTSSNLISSQHPHCHAPNVFGTVVIGDS